MLLLKVVEYNLSIVKKPYLTQVQESMETIITSFFNPDVVLYQSCI